MDNLTKEQRKRNMSNIKSKNTLPELAIRKALTKKGVRYRLHVNTLPGKPDVVISKLKKVIFINGCFWHQHNGCKRKVMPKTNKDYWRPKLNKNAKRQEEDIKKLREENWKTYVIWECELKNENTLNRKIGGILS